MHLVRLLLLVFGLAHLRGCFTPLCDAVRGYETQVIHTRTGDRVMNDIALLKDGGLLVDAGVGYVPPGEYHHTVVRVDEIYGPEEVVKLDLLTDYFGSGVVASGESWWYSIGGGRTPQESGVFFATPEVSFVRIDGLFDGDWMPFDGPEPHGLLVGHDRHGLRAIEVTRGGVKRQWSVPPTNTVGHRLRAAERLADGSIALVSIRMGGVFLELLNQQKEPQSFSLHESTSPVRVTTAVSDHGTVAVVVETTSGEIQAAVLDPRKPGELEWHRLTTKESPGRHPEVVFHNGGFIGAWLAPQADELHARTFTATGPGPLAVIAPLLRRGNRIPAISILPDGEEVVFAWREDEIMSRRVPAELAGFSFFERLCDLF